MATKNESITLKVPGLIEVRLDRAVSLELGNRGLFVGFNNAAPIDEAYPWVFTTTPTPRWIEPLHKFVWNFLNGVRRPLREGEILHHKNHNKNDARLSNLGPGTPKTHAMVHGLERQRFTIRKKNKLGGLFRPHAPENVKTVEGAEKNEIEKNLHARMQKEDEDRKAQEILAAKLAPREPDLNPEQVEEALTAVYGRLHPLVFPLNSMTKIPPPLSRPCQADRLLTDRENHKFPSIKRIRKGCTFGEVGLVYALVHHSFDLQAAALDVKLPVSTVEKMMKEPAVSMAIDNWHRYQRLPRPCSHKKLGIWLKRI